MTGKVLGKIKSAVFGINDADMFGLTFDLGGDGWGCGEFWGCYPKHVNVEFGKVALRIQSLLFAAKKTDVAKLAGTPIEAEFKDNTLQSWRLLTGVV